MSSEQIISAALILLMLLPISVLAAQQQVNLTITNTTITLANGGVTATFNNTPSSQAFQFNTTDCISTAGNFTVNVTTNLDYELIKKNTNCTLNYTLSCPTPTCPQPSCPQPTCPTLDYAQILSAIDTSSEKITGKLLEVNSSISSSNKGLSFSFPSYTPYVLIALAALAIFTKDKWYPKFQKAVKPQTEQKDDEPK